MQDILHSSDVGRAVELMSMTLQELKQHVGGKYANWPELWHAAAAAQPNLSQKKWLQSVAQSILLQNPLAAPGDVALPPRGMAQPIAPAHPTATAIPVAPAHPIATARRLAPAAWCYLAPLWPMECAFLRFQSVGKRIQSAFDIARRHRESHLKRFGAWR